jgi:CRISPR-associated endonuclease/helicase Cas3
MPEFYAHTIEGDPPFKWQGLEEHLLGVPKLAARFAEAFQSESWGYCAGLWHDLGKYQTEFQARLLGGWVSVQHSGSGAALYPRRGWSGHWASPSGDFYIGHRRKRVIVT